MAAWRPQPPGSRWLRESAKEQRSVMGCGALVCKVGLAVLMLCRVIVAARAYKYL